MRYIVTLLLCMFASVGLWAQGVTTASINGTVKDDNGNPLVGANVVAVHEPSGTRYGASTRDDGRYNLPGLRVGGPYTITASYIGYQDQTVQEIYLSLREDRRVDFTLSETALAGEAVTVVAERDAILSAANTGTVNNVTTAEIERLPTITRSITDFTRLAPMAAAGIGGSGGTSVAGKSNRYNNFQVDGAVLTDPFGLNGEGNSRGGRFPTSQVGAQPISLDAIQEFNVEIAPYDVRSGSFAGGLINAVTRSGTNRFTGSVYFFGQNESFVGDLVDEVTGESQEFADFDDFQAGFRLGGPIVRDKVFFFVNGEIHRRDQPTSAGLLDSNQPIKFGITSSQMQEIINIARNQYGYDPGGFDPFTLETNDDKIFARLDINLSNQHRLTLRHNFVNGDIDDGIDRGTDVFTLESNQFKRDNTTNSTVLQLNSLFGSRVANEARIAYTRIRDKRTPPGSPFPEVQINLEDTSGAEIGELRFGWERFSHANRLDQDVWEFTDNLHFFTGDHTITLGTHNELIQFDNLFMEAAFGAYEFASVEDFQRGRPTDFFLSVSRIPGVDRPSAKWDYLQLGFYVQDEWKATPRLNLTGGLRVDVPIISDEPLRNPTFEQDFPGFRTDQTPSGNIMWSPRFGFNYDLTGDRTTQIRGGVGLFAGLPPAVWLSNAFSNTGMDFLTIELSTFAGDSVPNFSPDPFNQPFV
ncbi:MAG: TonB-dependent receptor, partial [Calditrichaeota bacterium]